MLVEYEAGDYVESTFGILEKKKEVKGNLGDFKKIRNWSRRRLLFLSNVGCVVDEVRRN